MALMGDAEGQTHPDGDFIRLREDVYVFACKSKLVFGVCRKLNEVDFFGILCYYALLHALCFITSLRLVACLKVLANIVD